MKVIEKNTGKNKRERFPDVFRKFKRGPQIVTLKDCALISAYAGIGGGDIVIEAGAGSGFLTSYLANIVKPNGKIISYEKRKEFAEIAKKNVEIAGLQKIVKIKVKDIYKGIKESKVDAVVLDLAEPWKAVRHAKKALKNRCYLIAYLPTIEQVKKLAETCEKIGMKTKTIESINREMLIRSEATRPETKGLLHTGYIIIAKKIE